MIDQKTENFLKTLNNVEITDSEILLKQSLSAQETPSLKFSIYNLSLPRLRLNHFISDILSAKTFSGSINNSLFNLFKRQQKLTAVIENNNKNRMASSKFDFTDNNQENYRTVTHQDDRSASRFRGSAKKLSLPRQGPFAILGASFSNLGPHLGKGGHDTGRSGWSVPIFCNFHCLVKEYISY